MSTRYVAYGIELRSAFPLPGMTPTADGGSESLTLATMTPDELDDAWSGSTGALAWRGRLGDGCDLTIERGVEGDLLFDYEGHAHYLLSSDERSLSCAPLRCSPDWQRTLLGKVLPFVSVWRGHEALHASAIESPHGGVVAVLAPSGMGKTSLAVELIERGWPLFADDVLVLTEDAGGVRAHPGTPHMNLAEPEQPEVAPERLGSTLASLAGERWLAARNLAHEPRKVCLLCTLERHPSLSLDATPIEPSPLPLAPYMLGLAGDAERERRRFTLYASLVSRSPLVRVTCGSADRPSDLADLIERTLDSLQPLSTVGGVL